MIRRFLVKSLIVLAALFYLAGGKLQNNPGVESVQRIVKKSADLVTEEDKDRVAEIAKDITKITLEEVKSQ